MYEMIRRLELFGRLKKDMEGDDSRRTNLNF